MLTEAQFNILIQTLIGELTPKIDDAIRIGEFYSYTLPVPALKRGGWVVDASSNEFVPIWPMTLEKAFGPSLEALQFLPHLTKEIAPFFESNTPPPTKFFSQRPALNGAINLVHSLVESGVVSKNSLEFPNVDGLAKSGYEFLTRKHDDWVLEAPLSGLSVSKKMEFRLGSIEPTDDSLKLALYKQRAAFGTNWLSGDPARRCPDFR